MSDNFPFDDVSEAQLFHSLTHSLRCMVCQNQTLSESNAPLAIAVKNDIYKRVRLKQSEVNIMEWVMHEHGQCVSYKPPMTPLTSVLWFGPFMVLFVSLFWVYKRICKQ